MPAEVLCRRPIAVSCVPPVYAVLSTRRRSERRRPSLLPAGGFTFQSLSDQYCNSFHLGKAFTGLVFPVRRRQSARKRFLFCEAHFCPRLFKQTVVHK